MLPCRPSYLDFAHLVGLELSCTVMMNYSDPTHQLKPANQRGEITLKHPQKRNCSGEIDMVEQGDN